MLHLKVEQQFLKNLLLHYLSTKRTFLGFIVQVTKEYSDSAGLALISSLLSLAARLSTIQCRNNFVI